MFAWILRGCRDECSASDQLKQVTMSSRRKRWSQKKISQEVERAKEFTKSGNKQAAMQCLKRKRYYESQMNQVGSVQLRINTKERMIADHTGNK
ncbi:Vacuolar protein sorting-associated protein 32 1 [Zea mays]|uniref:Vacuolar protein sorting-associated protein 32 1 n=1 Tax=Zea mays TaxID=4577 RepID=A0A3L6D831_MAIZE|nr:Vacuolar protein sorting-associated protein 32 1 [Zea mays]